jgi:hypothetical protein
MVSSKAVQLRPQCFSAGGGLTWRVSLAYDTFFAAKMAWERLGVPGVHHHVPDGDFFGESPVA